MTTFDVDEVRGFVADLDDRMIRCQNGEGFECATLDALLRHHAVLCCEFVTGIRAWAREVFVGRLVNDPEVESVWLSEGARLYNKAKGMHSQGLKANVPCYELEGREVLQLALLEMDRLFKTWVSPKLAVAPSARGGFVIDPSMIEKGRQWIASLPPLPADWKPLDPRQQAFFRMLPSS